MRHRFVIAVLLAMFLTASAIGQQRLLVVGGGKRPAEAMQQFAKWSGGERATILVITWASGEPEPSFEALKRDIVAAGPLSVEHAPIAPLNAEKRTILIAQLASATGVFFSGGDQNRIMDVLADEELLRLIREKYGRGTPFGGTSAGAAVMSDPMMTGDADLKILDGKQVGVRKGLGLIPNVIFDQHFLIRQRHNRLFGLIEVNPNYLGIGIDEDNAVLIEDNRNLTVAGPTQVMFVDAKKVKHGMAVYFLRTGQRFDLKKRKRF